jgi:prolyl-tRNA synthetase
MIWNHAFIHTLREEPAEAETISHKLMLRAGMIQKLSAGIYNYLPLGLRVIKKIEGIIRQEMGRCNAAELLLPMVVPAELWKESGRWDYYGPELLRFTDRKNNPFCLGPTHEEVIVDVVRKAVRSYRDLPLCLYQIQTKFRDEVRPRYGLMRGREFIMKDAYSFHADEKSLDEMYWIMYEAYKRIFTRCGLTFRPVEADSGNIGGSVTHEFHVLAQSGEDTIAFCDACDYTANLEKASSKKPDGPAAIPVTGDGVPVAEAGVPVEVATPGKTSIEDVSSFLKIAPGETVKMLVYEVDGGEYFAGVCIRGDCAVNEAKLRNVLNARAVAIAPDEVVRSKLGCVVGYMGPYKLSCPGLKEIIADNSITGMGACVCGANKEGYHLTNIVPSRDLTMSRYEDVGFVAEGDICPRCNKGKLQMCKGIEVGQVFKLGQKYSKPMSLTFLTDKDTDSFMTMGCYGIGVGRTAAAAIEQNNDEHGILWPVPIAPYTVTVLCLDPLNQEALMVSHTIHDGLEACGFDVLLDDRAERPGVKFIDADLIGCPFRVTVGARGLKEGMVEVKRRSEKKFEKVPKDNCIEILRNIMKKELEK